MPKVKLGPLQTSVMQSSATIVFNNNCCYKALHLRCLQESWLHFCMSSSTKSRVNFRSSGSQVFDIIKKCLKYPKGAQRTLSKVFPREFAKFIQNIFVAGHFHVIVSCPHIKNYIIYARTEYLKNLVNKS